MDNFLYLNFPSYYSTRLGSDVKCYYPSGEIFCNFVDRFLTIYSAGTSFTLTITGVVMEINYNSGTFSITAGTFTDFFSSTILSIQNFPTDSLIL